MGISFTIAWTVFTQAQIRHPEVLAAKPRASKDERPWVPLSICCAAGITLIMFGSATGCDLSRRVDEHLRGGYTSSRLPVTLVWSEYFDRITDAIAVERKLKGWGRRKKEALIEGNWDQIKHFAKRRGSKK